MKENENDREEEIISPISTSGKKQETNFPTFLWSWVTKEGQLFPQYLLFLSLFFPLVFKIPKKTLKMSLKHPPRLVSGKQNPPFCLVGPIQKIPEHQHS